MKNYVVHGVQHINKTNKWTVQIN